MARHPNRKNTAPASAAPRAADPAALLVVGLAWAIAAAMVVRVAIDSAAGVFATDECFHASVSQMLLRTHAWPVELPQFYSGFFYYYPPLFHVVSAVWLAIFGVNGLHVLPGAIGAATLATLAFSGRRAAPIGALAGTALVFAAHRVFTDQWARYYVEGFSGLLAIAATLAIVAWWRAPSLRGAIAAGVLTGLGVMSKVTAATPLLLMAGAAVVAMRPGSERPARQLGLALAIALAIGLVVPIHNLVYFRSFFYPMQAWDLDRELYALNFAKFSTPPANFFAGLPIVIGPVLGAAILGAAAAFAMRPRFGIWEAALVLALLTLLVMPFVPFMQARHLLPFFAIAALASLAMIFERLEAAPVLRNLVLVVLIGAAVMAHANYQNPRRQIDLPANLKQAFDDMRPLLKPDDLVLSLWTYDTAWYTGARATWPNPWGQRPEKRPLAMFTATDPARFVAALRERGITHVVLPSVVAEAPFNSANYPPSFVNAMNACLREQRIGPVWKASDLFLVKVAP